MLKIDNVDIMSVMKWREGLMFNDSIIIDLFQGQTKNTITCNSCKNSSTTFENTLMLS